MIRIDLGKPESKGRSGTSVSDLITRVREKIPGKFPGGRSGKSKTGIKDISSMVLAIAVALLPYLFVSQYKGYVKNQHELQMQRLQERVTQLNTEIAKYQSFQRELESYEKQKKLIKERIQIVRQLLEARNTPVNAFDAIGQSLPEKAWLSLVELKAAPKPSIVISGEAYSNEDISDYVDKLSESIQLKDVNLESVTSVKTSKDLEVKQFTVGAMPSGQMGIMTEVPRENAGQQDQKK